MSEEFDFEGAWQAKLSDCLDRLAGEEIRRAVVAGGGALSSGSAPREVIDWSRGAMERLESSVAGRVCIEVMTGCACQYPKNELRPVRELYEETGSIDRAHQMLQEKFESFLRDELGLDQAVVEDVVGRGWGVAGRRTGDTIVATKIPRSGRLLEYLREPDREKRRHSYCHCPRVREAIEMGQTLPLIYCYCGAGYYKGIWEEILQEPVEVEVVESVLRGDDVCTIIIRLPVA